MLNSLNLDRPYFNVAINIKSFGNNYYNSIHKVVNYIKLAKILVLISKKFNFFLNN